MARFTLKLDEYTLRKLIEAARAAEVTPGRMAGMMLEAWVRDEVGPGPERAQSGVEEPARAWADAADDADGPDPHMTPADRGGPVVELVEPMRSRFAGMAKDGGVPQEVLAAAVLDSRLFDYDDFEWPEGGDPRTAVSEPIVEEELRDWEEVRPELEAYLEEKLKARR
ncbi:MAG: hypothetical protein Q8R45_12200 [Brevundimonas sp.]|uniref:hypothetical protein n=1 Tax=Brevundimonas sp. TaxID=1871086 RepID=UPI0027173DBB|nr:hypothetical protein [Brevundimonas sp.]MDO9587601.1 hypothetical protein [Brevundimonas sp.]MDP3657711.1 hypothetical protein [Brevundimonas sp.]MDZ4112728.1 hypothetical protein [Brevundimonas sp.]